MVELPGGDVVAATVPGGKLVRIDGKGKVTPFAALEGVEQIWALVIHDGKLLAGTESRLGQKAAPAAAPAAASHAAGRPLHQGKRRRKGR
jgi:hypothetical protein